VFGKIGKVRKMSFQANVLKVMIASPEEVAEERKVVTGAIYRWNDANAAARRLVLLPIKWEVQNNPPLGVPAQAIINRQLLDGADIVIGIFGPRTGTPPNGSTTGTVEDIKKHVAAGKTAKVYFSDVRNGKKSIDQNPSAMIQKFREELNGSGLSGAYESLQQFRDDFEHDLAIEMDHPRYRWLDVPNRTAGVPHLKSPIIDTPVKTPIVESPIVDEVQKNHVDELLRSVGCVQRDLLRFLLLKGGIARADVVARSRTTKNALEMNGLCGPLEQKNLLTRTPDHKYGYSTLAVNEGMMGALPKSLFPREEDDPPFFEGIEI